MDVSTPDLEEHDAELKKAVKELAENVSIVGLKEAIVEPILWIRRIFQIALAISLICVLYFICGVAVTYLRRDYTDDIKLIYGQESLPLSNVTICADVTVSKTFVRKNVTVPDPLLEKLASATGYTKTEFLDAFVEWISVTMTRRNVEKRLTKYFRMLIDANPQMSRFTPFLRSAAIQCRDMLKVCKFAEKNFDCCKNAKPILDDNAVCYQIALSQDINSRQSSPATRRQSILGQTGGLTIEAAVDLNDAPWFADTASAGFKIYVHPTAVTPLQFPMTAPSEAETFVKVTARERIWNRNCLQIGNSPEVYEGGYYDSFGHMCMTDRLQDASRTAINCIGPYMHHNPNATVECGPEANYLYLNLGMQADANELFGISDGDNSAFAKASRKFVARTEKNIRSVSQFRRQCPPRCRYWEYSSTASFVDLIKKNEFGKYLLYSRVHVFYTDFLYQQKEEILAVNFYLAFYNFGNVIVLYLGLSIVGIFEVIFWFSNFFAAFLRSRCAKRGQNIPVKVIVKVRIKRIRRVQVAPL